MPGVYNKLDDYYTSGEIGSDEVYNPLYLKLDNAVNALTGSNPLAAGSQLEAFIDEVRKRSGDQISPPASRALSTDARWFLDHSDLAVTARLMYWARAPLPPLPPKAYVPFTSK